MNVLIVVLLALATPEGDYKSALGSYERYQYDQTVQKLTALLQTPPANAKLRQDSRALLAFAHYMKRDEASARSALHELFRENVDYALDRDVQHPDLVRFYDTERNAYVAALQTKPLALQPPPAARPTLGDRQPWLRAIPLGVGQFVNQDYVTGAIFMGLELALIGLNVAGSVWRYSLQNPGGTFRPGGVVAPRGLGGRGRARLGGPCALPQ